MTNERIQEIQKELQEAYVKASNNQKELIIKMCKDLIAFYEQNSVNDLKCGEAYVGQAYCGQHTL